MQTLWIVKRSNEPAINENAVYVFKDQGGEPAGRLIELAGMRGTRIGDVEISAKDSNFFIAGPNASSDDVLRLVDLVQTRVSDRLGVETGTLVGGLVVVGFGFRDRSMVAIRINCLSRTHAGTASVTIGPFGTPSGLSPPFVPITSKAVLSLS